MGYTQKLTVQDTCLAQPEQHTTLDLGVESLSPMLGVVITQTTLKKKLTVNYTGIVYWL